MLHAADGSIVGALHFTAPGKMTPQEKAVTALETESSNRATPRSPTVRGDRDPGNAGAEAAKLNPEAAANAQRGRAHTEAVHAHRPTGPHWYFRDLVVSPRMQGAGLGSTLLSHRLAVVDQDPLPVFLESTSPGSRRLYERFGFEHVATVEAVPGGIAYVMIRPAQTR